MSFLRNLYFFQGEKYTSFGKNILHRQSASLGHSATGHSAYISSELRNFDFDTSLVAKDGRVIRHSVIFPRGVVHRVENGWGLTKVAAVLLNGLLW